MDINSDTWYFKDDIEDLTDTIKNLKIFDSIINFI